MTVDRQTVAEQIEKMLAGEISREDVGWWAFDILVEDKPEFEPGWETLLQDVIRALYYFHDSEPLAQQFCPDHAEILYFLDCLRGKEVYQRAKVVHWRV